MTPASKVGTVPNPPDECQERPEWQLKLLERLLLGRGYPAHLVQEKAIQIFDWVAQAMLDREIERAIYGAAMDEPIGIMGQYKGAGDEP